MKRPSSEFSPSTGGQLLQHIAYEKLITAISTRFIDISAGEIDVEIWSALKALGTFAGHDRSYVVLLSQDGSLFETVYEWCAEDIPPHRHGLQGRLARAMPWFNQKISQGEIVRLSCIDPQAGNSLPEYEECREEGIRSILMVPMLAHSNPVGLLGFDALRAERVWEEDEIALLQIVGEIIVSALERKRAEEALLEANQILEIRVAERTREIEQRSRASDALRDILRVLNSNRELPDVLDYIVTQAGKLLGASTTLIREADLPHQIATTAASYNLPDDFDSIRSTRLYYNANDLILMSKRPVVIADIPATYRPMLEMRETLDPIQQGYIEALLRHFHSMLSVPLFIRDELYGSMNFFYSQQHEFSEDDIQLSMSLADQAALAIENSRLRSQREKDAIASERNRLARDLHDAVTQTLFSASLIAEVLPRIWERNPEEGRRRLEELRQLSRGALAEMRTLLLELRPATLTEAHFGDLLRQLSEAVSGRARLPIHLEVEGDIALDADVQVGLYRIAQEALNNVVKHSQAHQVKIRLVLRSRDEHLQSAPRSVDLLISDDGVGFDPSAIPADHFGMGIMQERAQAIGAVLTVESHPGQGARIQVYWQD